MSKPLVLIVGAGPGGLCLALTLQRRGIPHLVLERATGDRLFADVGGGYDIGENSLKMLDCLGIGQTVRRDGRKTAELLSYTSAGALFDRMRFPTETDIAGVLRSSLQRAFLNALAPDVVRCNAKVVDVRDADDGVQVSLADGSRLRGDVLVGADGIHSAVRSAILPDDPPPHFCGLSCAWGRTPVDRLSDQLRQLLPPRDRAISIMGPGRLFLAGSPGQDWLWSGFWRTAHFDRSRDQTHAAQAVSQQFEQWSALPRGLIEHARPESIVEVGIWDRDPVATWTRGRCVLIGDAAHPMTPFLGQGANSAMIDAFVLGNLITEQTPSDAFANYEARRKTAVEKNVKSARSLARWMTTHSRLSALAFRSMMRLIPSSLLTRAVTSADAINDVDDLIPRVRPAA